MSLAGMLAIPVTLPNGAVVRPLRLGDLAMLEQWCGDLLSSPRSADRLRSGDGLAAILDHCTLIGPVRGHFAKQAIWAMLCDVNSLPQRPARVTQPLEAAPGWPAVLARRLGCLPHQLARLTPYQVLTLLGWEHERLVCDSRAAAMAMLAGLQPMDVAPADQAVRFAAGLQLRIWQMQCSAQASASAAPLPAASPPSPVLDHLSVAPTPGSLLTRLERLVGALTERPPAVFGA